MAASRLAPLVLMLSLGLHASATISETLERLRAAPNAAARLKVLSPDEQIFDFERSTVGLTMGKDGTTVSATSSNAPMLFGQDMALTVGYLGPCGMNTPHIHPRSPELNFVSVGGPLLSSFVAENGADVVVHRIERGQATLFPAGAIHFEQNLGCTPAQFVASFNNGDPGVLQVAQRFNELDPEIQNAVYAYPGTPKLLELHNRTAANVAYGTLECLKRCGLDPDNLPDFTIDRVAIIEAAFAGSLAGSTRSNGGSGALSIGSSKLQGDPSLTLGDAAAYPSTSLGFFEDPSKLRPAFLATLAILIALLLGVAGFAIVSAIDARKHRRQSGAPLLYGPVLHGDVEKDTSLSYADPHAFSLPPSPAPQRTTL